MYFLDAIDVLFCGDTLFAMGCGRVFEGTYQQMYHSLARLAALPPRTQVYCTHEYTLSNAQFAKHVEPDNPAILERFEQVERMRMLDNAPYPVRLQQNWKPILLRADSVEEFQRLRVIKDSF